VFTSRVLPSDNTVPSNPSRLGLIRRHGIVVSGLHAGEHGVVAGFQRLKAA